MGDCNDCFLNTELPLILGYNPVCSCMLFFTYCWIRFGNILWGCVSVFMRDIDL